MMRASTMMARAATAAFSGLLLAATLWVAAASAQPSAEDLKKAVREILRENPDLVMEVLKENSETVLEIAQQGSILRQRKAIREQWREDARKPKKIDLEDRAFKGPADAPVTIVAYSDYTCPFCRKAEAILEQLLKKYDGKIRLTFKALPKDDPTSLLLARFTTAAFMLDKQKGWQLHDMLFRDLKPFEKDGEQFLKETSLSLGYDYKKLRNLAAGEAVRKRLAQDREEADGLKITGTPYFLVNDLLVRGAVSRDLFEEAIEMALGKGKERS